MFKKLFSSSAKELIEKRIKPLEAFSKDIWRIVLILLIKNKISPEELIKRLQTGEEEILKYSRGILKTLDKQREERDL